MRWARVGSAKEHVTAAALSLAQSWRGAEVVWKVLQGTIVVGLLLVAASPIFSHIQHPSLESFARQKKKTIWASFWLRTSLGFQKPWARSRCPYRGEWLAVSEQGVSGGKPFQVLVVPSHPVP